jgi:hypothetical protein
MTDISLLIDQFGNLSLSYVRCSNFFRHFGKARNRLFDTFLDSGYLICCAGIMTISKSSMPKKLEHRNLLPTFTNLNILQ